MIRGSLHVLDTGAENFYVIFASEVGTGSHLVSGGAGVEHFGSAREFGETAYWRGLERFSLPWITGIGIQALGGTI
jgi:hypothetical protein